jgi:hypothetical protein
MNLPIDFRSTHIPIKEKYIDEETPLLSRWMVFGLHSEDGTVDVCDSQGGDVLVHVPVAQANRIVKERNIWVGQLLETLNGRRAFPGWPPC